jgi:phage shock protein E
MLSFLKSLVGNRPTASLGELLAAGAVVIDVRTPQEYSGGHIAGSKNIPLQVLEQSLETLPSNKTIVFCCASGTRSGIATAMAKRNGCIAVNGGSWHAVQRAVKEQTT